MKKDIHPVYNTKAHVKCACGNEFIIGSTLENIDIESCSACHPFYTGQERGAVRGGRVEKFKSRLEQKKDFKKKSGKKDEKKERKEK
ncbi:50S ribosomal protein L31, partial [Patescibacteria group bacterium]|nr:50S ribosomal protein L31 [Patescibacteria group bacterium]